MVRCDRHDGDDIHISLSSHPFCIIGLEGPRAVSHVDQMDVEMSGTFGSLERLTTSVVWLNRDVV